MATRRADENHRDADPKSFALQTQVKFAEVAFRHALNGCGRVRFSFGQCHALMHRPFLSRREILRQAENLFAGEENDGIVKGEGDEANGANAGERLSQLRGRAKR